MTLLNVENSIENYSKADTKDRIISIRSNLKNLFLSWLSKISIRPLVMYTSCSFGVDPLAFKQSIQGVEIPNMTLFDVYVGIRVSLLKVREQMGSDPEAEAPETVVTKLDKLVEDLIIIASKKAPTLFEGEINEEKAEVLLKKICKNEKLAMDLASTLFEGNEKVYTKLVDCILFLTHHLFNNLFELGGRLWKTGIEKKASRYVAKAIIKTKKSQQIEDLTDEILSYTQIVNFWKEFASNIGYKKEKVFFGEVFTKLFVHYKTLFSISLEMQNDDLEDSVLTNLRNEAKAQLQILVETLHQLPLGRELADMLRTDFEANTLENFDMWITEVCLAITMFATLGNSPNTNTSPIFGRAVDQNLPKPPIEPELYTGEEKVPNHSVNFAMGSGIYSERTVPVITSYGNIAELAARLDRTKIGDKWNNFVSADDRLRMYFSNFVLGVILQGTLSTIVMGAIPRILISVITGEEASIIESGMLVDRSRTPYLSLWSFLNENNLGTYSLKLFIRALLGGTTAGIIKALYTGIKRYISQSDQADSTVKKFIIEELHPLVENVGARKAPFYMGIPGVLAVDQQTGNPIIDPKTNKPIRFFAAINPFSYEPCDHPPFLRRSDLVRARDLEYNECWVKLIGINPDGVVADPSTLPKITKYRIKINQGPPGARYDIEYDGTTDVIPNVPNKFGVSLWEHIAVKTPLAGIEFKIGKDEPNAPLVPIRDWEVWWNHIVGPGIRIFDLVESGIGLAMIFVTRWLANRTEIQHNLGDPIGVGILEFLRLISEGYTMAALGVLPPLVYAGLKVVNTAGAAPRVEVETTTRSVLDTTNGRVVEVPFMDNIQMVTRSSELYFANGVKVPPGSEYVVHRETEEIFVRLTQEIANQLGVQYQPDTFIPLDGSY